MDYTIELEQVGKRGTTIFSCSFGLVFTADLYIQKDRWTKIPRVLTFLSTCHGAILDSSADGFVCHVCKSVSLFETNSMTLPEDSDSAVSLFEPFMQPFFEDYIENMIYSLQVIHSVNEHWTAIKSGNTSRSIITLDPNRTI